MIELYYDYGKAIGLIWHICITLALLTILPRKYNLQEDADMLILCILSGICTIVMLAVYFGGLR